MAVVLANNLLAVQLPQAGVVVGAGGDEVGRVGAEGAVPDPALVAGEGGLEGVGLGLGGGVGGLVVAVDGDAADADADADAGAGASAVNGERAAGQGRGAGDAERGRGGLVGGRGGGDVGDLPDLGGVVGGAGGELLDVGGQQDAGDVLLVGAEVGDGEQVGALVGLDQLPDEDVALGGCEYG